MELFTCCGRKTVPEQHSENPFKCCQEDKVDQLTPDQIAKQREFFKAIEDMDVERIKCFKDEGFEMKTAKEYPSKKEAFHFLAEIEDDVIISEDHLQKIVDILLEAGCQVNGTDRFGNTPLMLASEKGNLKILRSLLNMKADIEKTNEGGNGPLHWACKNEKREAVNVLLRHEANINAQNKDFQTPLHLAVIEDKKKVIQLLLSNNADVNLKDLKNQWTPLQYAKSKSMKDLFKPSTEVRKLGNVKTFVPDHLETDHLDQEFAVWFKDVDLNTVDPSTVAEIFSKKLDQNKLSMKDLPEKMVKKCRYFCTHFKSKERYDVIRELRKTIQAGLTGPLADNDEFVSNMDRNVRQKLTRSLCAQERWKLMADAFGIPNNEFGFYDRKDDPAESVLGRLITEREVTIGELYHVLADRCEAAALADQYL